MTMWVFGYGSLLWNPGFEPAEAVTATLTGYHRSFCMLSIHHRGTVEEPGLVLALDEGDSTCVGVAFRVAEMDEVRVLGELRERELISSAYEEVHVPLSLQDGRDVQALAYVINRTHEQYCQFDLERQAQMIARSVGGRGPNPEYLFNTADHLVQMGIEDPDMTWLVRRVRELA
ncbi:cation transport protein ChaC [Octadecabacter temperatus]|uniref:glutathione-specific gamma-glutamylcyclotransferase n=1 Tax=Octadecabacter temperatus TaxID=1458307 RepID=A0A0K0Y2M3_9RHOB|nr:gamma-glutamylcyclotransferase [Octadecabacter temperatus]AKS45184.1 ChaC-like protein [Octadecabacter temperatus]SIN87818.1 cation transport protein ChaC [Octadecabacter temperatus]